MQIIGGPGKNIHEQVRNSIGAEAPDMVADFFKPVGAQDPHTRPVKTKVVPPRFNFKLLQIAGACHSPEDDVEYIRIMNCICTGEYTNSTEDTYHDKDGNIQVFLRWLEWPNGGNPNTPPKDEDFDVTVLGETDKERRNREKSEKKLAKKKDEEDSPALDPQVTF